MRLIGVFIVFFIADTVKSDRGLTPESLWYNNFMENDQTKLGHILFFAGWTQDNKYQG